MRAREILSENKVTDNKYIPAVNTLLQRQGINLPIEKKAGQYIDFFPNPNQQVKDISDPIEGQVNGEQISILVKNLYKSDIIRNIYTGSPEDKVNINRGELAEGFHAVAVFARLIKRPLNDISLKDIQSIISRLENGRQLTLTKKEVESSIADKFELMIKLKPRTWKHFTDPATVAKMGGTLDSIINDANSESSRFAERFATNDKFDVARVVGDGVSEESERKADVQFYNEAEKKFAGFSLKTSTTKQVHQVGGGNMVDSKNGKKATPEERYEKLATNLFAVDGRFPLADISPAKAQILKAKSVLEMQKIAYKAAVASLNTHLQTGAQEKDFILNLVGAMKYWIGRDDPNIKLKQFTDRGSYILDPNRVDYLIDNDRLDLSAKYSEGKDGLPKITIYDKNRNKDLVSIRTKIEAKGYFRNLIEKEQIWVLLTKIKELPNIKKTPKQQKTSSKQQVAPQQSVQQAPDELDAVKKNAGIQPKMKTPPPVAGNSTANPPPPVNNRV
jgi:hypothetical protein